MSGPITVDVNALQDLPQDEQLAIDDLTGAELMMACWFTCLRTCAVTEYRF
jgi:hypothetical protein